jgi:hypothetical protein
MLGSRDRVGGDGRRCPQRFRQLCVGLVLLAALSPGVWAQGSPTLSVRYRSADTVYLDSGRAAGLAVGDLLVVVRVGRPVANLEVVFVAEHSASCRIVAEQESVVAGDQVMLAEAAGDSTPDPAGELESDLDATAVPPPTEGDLARAEVRTRAYEAAPKRPSTRVDGSIAVELESFTDDSEAGLDFQRSQLRLNLRVRDLGGTPLQLGIRVRGQENRRQRSFGIGAPENESRNRLYEAALLWAPPESRFKIQAGRIGTSPFVSIGYLDGFVGEFRLGRSFDVGAFYGSQPRTDEITFESLGQKFGGYARFSAMPRGAASGFQLFLAGVREQGKEDVSRDYVAVETRYTPAGRWSVFQRAEVDLNQGWRGDASDSSAQLSLFSLTVNARLSDVSRFSISYDRNERYRTEDTRYIPDELFDDLARQGLRARVAFGRPAGLQFSLQGGIRQRDDGEDDTYSYGFGVLHPDVASWGLTLGGDVLGYSNRYTDGYVVRGRAAKRIRGGHQLTFSVGGRLSQDNRFGEFEDRSTYWARLGGWAELPRGFYAYGDYEFNAGDDLEGPRLLGGLGWRF